MSETTEAQPATDTPDPASDAPEQEAPAVEQAATDTPEAQPEAPPEAEKKSRAAEQIAINRLTREKHEARRRLEAAEKEAAIYKALAEGRVGPDGAVLPPSQERTESEIERRAREMIGQQRTEERRRALVSNGAKEYGEAAWNEKTQTIALLGATENAAFMQAIVSVPNGQKIVAALADDPDKAATLLQMEPLEMAAEMGRLAAELAPPKPRVSQAPRPVDPLRGRATPEPDVYDTKSSSMAEWVALRNKQAPRHLGGQGKRG